MDTVLKNDFKSGIIYTKILADLTLAVVDTKCSVYLLDKNTLDIKHLLSLDINHPRFETNLVCVNDKGSLFATTSTDNRKISAFDLETNEQKEFTSRHSGEISSVIIDPKNRYIFTGGEDGKIFAIDIRNDKLSFQLPVHVDTINDITISSNSQWIATASYDKKISLYNIAMMKLKFRLKVHTAPVIKVCFLSDYRLFSVDKQSVGIVWNMHDSKIIKRVQGIHDDVVQVTQGGDDKLLFLGTKLGYVLVYDLDTYELIERRFIKLREMITSMCFDNEDNHLIVGTESGKLLIYDIYEGKEQIKELILQKRYKEVEDLVKEKVLLKYTDAYKSMMLLWEKTLKVATDFLGKGQKQKAMQIFGQFLAIPSKKSKINKLFEEFEEFDKFAMFVSQEKYSLAYSLANKHPVYKETKVYKSMELRWKKDFMLAQKILLQTKSAQKVKDILAPYRGISEKTKLIQDLILNANVYERFKKALNKKDYKACVELAKNHPFLKEYQEYHDLQKESDQLYIHSQKLLQNGEKYKALKLLNILLSFDEFKDDAKDMIIEIQDSL
jgi:WD40 repeat protein